MFEDLGDYDAQNFNLLENIQLVPKKSHQIQFERIELNLSQKIYYCIS